MSKIATIIVIVALLALIVLSYIAGTHDGKQRQLAVLRTLSKNFLTISTKDSNDYKAFEDAKFEILRVVFNDGVWFQLTSFIPIKIETNSVEFSSLVRTAFRRDVSDVVRVVHNHFLKSKLPSSFTDASGMTYEIINANPLIFSEADIQFYNEITMQGFKGEFCIWVDGNLITYQKETKQ